MKYSLGIFNFLEEISSLSHSVVFLYFFALITEDAFLSLLAILWNSAFRCLYLSFSPLLFTSLLFSAICKASSDSHFAFLLFFFLGMVLITTSYTMLAFHTKKGNRVSCRDQEGRWGSDEVGPGLYLYSVLSLLIAILS